MSRQNKQILYGSAFLIIILTIVGVFLYNFLKPAPTCFDNIKNQDEEDIDCGGANCIVCELKHDPLSTTSVKIFDQGDFLFILGELKNSSLNYGATKFQYMISLNAANGKPIYTISNQSYIYPAQARKMLVAVINKKDNPAVSWDLISESNSKLTVSNPEWVLKNIFARPEVHISSHDVSVTDGVLTVSGKIKNESNFSVEDADIIAIITDSFGNFLGVGKTSAFNLDAFDEKAFHIFSTTNAQDASLAEVEFFIEAK